MHERPKVLGRFGLRRVCRGPGCRLIVVVWAQLCAAAEVVAVGGSQAAGRPSWIGTLGGWGVGESAGMPRRTRMPNDFASKFNVAPYKERLSD